MMEREIDALIAEHVLGWQLKDNQGAAGGRFWVGHGGSFGDMPENALPRFSTEIAAAEEVKKVCHGWVFSRRRAFLSAIEDVVRTRMGIRVAWPDLWLYIEPRDVCLAALKAVGVEVPAP